MQINLIYKSSNFPVYIISFFFPDVDYLTPIGNFT